MADPVAIAKVAPRAIYYVVIDGTAAKDSATFGAMIEKKFGFRNLLGSFLPRVEDHPTFIDGDANRLIDEAHPYLPIHVHEAEGRKVAVVEVGGRDCIGKDSFWRDYAEIDAEGFSTSKHVWKEEEPREDWVTFGRHTAHEQSARFMKKLILQPALEVTPGTNPIKARIHDEHPELKFPWPEHLLRAELLLVSSHGWLGGFMRGNAMQQWDKAEPEEARKPRWPPIFFSIGEAAHEGKGFRGPLWIILAQCSTANKATWELWTKVFANSSPHVRGLLAYEESSPGVSGSIAISRRFFNALRKKKTILESWKAANHNQKWAAIVHKDAMQDRIQDWRSFKPIESASTNESEGSYLGFLRSIASGEEIKIKEPSFKVELAMLVTHPKNVGPENLHKIEASFQPFQLYTLRVHGPAGEKIRSTVVRFVNIRETYATQFEAKSIFNGVDGGHDDTGLVGGLSDGKPATISIRVETDARPSIFFRFQTRKKEELDAAKLQVHHSYLWLDVEVTTDVGTKHRHQFQTIGLTYW